MVPGSLVTESSKKDGFACSHWAGLHLFPQALTEIQVRNDGDLGPHIKKLFAIPTDM